MRTFLNSGRWLLLLFVIGITGCGFQLRGVQTPWKLTELSPLYLDFSKTNMDVMNQRLLATWLKRQNIQLSDSADSAKAHLQILEEKKQEYQQLINMQNQATSWVMQYRLRSVLVYKGKHYPIQVQTQENFQGSYNQMMLQERRLNDAATHAFEQAFQQLMLRLQRVLSAS